LESKLQLGSSDKANWLKNHTLSEEERKKLIDKKLERVYNQKEFERKSREFFSYD
jgi:hypothetical protein